MVESRSGRSEGLIVDASTIPMGSNLSFDLCIVGSGPAGLTLASQLARPGLRVCLLESGGMARDRGTDGLADGRSTGLPYHKLRKARVRALGGSSNHWHTATPSRWPVDGGMRSRSLDPIDFEARSWLSESGWPIDADDLAPYFERAETLYGLAPLLLSARGQEDPSSSELRRAVAGFLESGICAFATRDVFDRLGARLAATPALTILLHANAVSIGLEEAAAVATSVTVRSLGGNQFTVGARLFVLAAGGIDNARLLLASNTVHRPGIGNQHDQVGRYFMDHIEVEAGSFAPQPGRPLPDLDFFRRRYASGEPVIGLLRLPDETQRDERLLNTVAALRPRSRLFVRPAVRAAAELFGATQQSPRRLDLGARLGAIAADPVGVGSAVVQKVTGRAGRDPDVATLILTSEQVPNPLSRVTLDRRRDALGMPRAVLHWRATDHEAASFRRTRSLIVDALRSAGLRDMGAPPGGIGAYRGCWHHAGTTRMGMDPRRSVVDPTCRVHGIANLYVAGSSVMPTTGATTITLTIAALALRLADHLARELAH